MFKLYDFVKRHENLVIKNSPSKRPFSERRQTLFGSLLGDGSLVKKSEKSYCYAECHAKKQAFYLIWKMFMGFLENQTVRKVVGKGNRQDQLYLRGKICVYRRHDKIHGLFYKKSSKPKRRFIKNPELRYILPRLDPLGLAVWYCDDGSYSRGQKTSFLSMV
jgi:hypothetical protein